MKSKIKKKILSIILAVVTTVVSMPLVPVKAAPENDTASGNENDEQYIISSEASDNTMDASGNSFLGEVSIAITAPTSHRSEIDGIVIFRMNKTEAMQMAENDKIYIKGSVEPADLANDHKISLLIWDDMGMEDIIENCESADDGSITYGYSVSGCVADHHVIFRSSKNDDISKEVELQICFDTPIVSLKDNKLRISNKDSDPLAKYYLVYFDGAQWLYEPIFEDDQTEYEISYRLSGIKDAYVTVSRFGASEYIENFSYDTLSANSASFDLPVITERTLDSSGIYQVSGNTSISTPYPNTLFDVKVITDIDMLEESTVSGDIVSSDESGRIEIDPKWLGHDISIVAKGG
ncbi:MAG: hypothetical protein K6E77_07170, partial [Lachnospiraceae bacterium]|nr:hypothetical protein [Lachnospiraceae bacterium]